MSTPVWHRARTSISGSGLRSATPPCEVLGDVCIDCGSLCDIRLAAGGIALLHFRDPTAIERFGPIGLEPQRRIVVGDCVIVLRAVAICDCTPVKSDAERGIETQRLVIIFDGAVGIALNGIGKASVCEMGAVFRIEPNSFSVIDDRSLVVPCA